MADEQKKFDIALLFRKAKLPKELAAKLSIVIALVVLLAMMFPRGESVELEYKVGAVWAQKDLIAPFSFPVFRDDHDYAHDVEEAKRRVFEVFERDTQTVDAQRGRFDDFFRRLEETLAARAEYRRSVRLRRETIPEDSIRFSQNAAALDIPFSEKEWDALALFAADGRLSEVREFLTSAMRGFLGVGILDRSKTAIERAEVAIRKGTTEEIVPLNRLYDQGDIVTLLEKRLEDHFGSENDVVGIAYKIGVTHIVPNLKFNPTATDQAIAAAVDAVSRTTGFVQENERIISKHERVTPEMRLKLESLRRARADRGPATDAPTQFLGTLLHVVLVLILFGIYLFLFRKQIVGNNRRLAMIAFLFLLIGFFAYITRELDVTVPIEYLIAVPAVSMLLTIVFDSRVGFYSTVTMAFLVSGIRGNDYSVAFAALIAGALAVYTVRDMKNRSQIFRSLGFIFLGYAMVIVALGLERYESMNVVGEQLLFALANAVLSPVLTYGLLIFLERVFRVTTDLTLIELAHFNHPLLRLLAEKAPGTYHHSMSMASLAEAASAAVGANEVLARVAGYFHDVGKILKPTYFVENQRGTRSRHDKLSPRMSSLIIGAHVKDGMALAREYRLPEEVIDFIPMHHGTTRIDYFYNKALELARNSPDETKIDEINEEDYRYPGPKPQTKETGIMMLADAIEAAVRTLDEPTPQRLQGIIDELIKKRFEEGELDECPLTMKDLTRIKAAFLNVLVGIYHSRVKYPELPKKRARKQPPVAIPSDEEGPAPASGPEPEAEPEQGSGPEAQSGPDLQPGPDSQPGPEPSPPPPPDDRIMRTIKEIDRE